jgi:hypothetical protein
MPTIAFLHTFRQTSEAALVASRSCSLASIFSRLPDSLVKLSRRTKGSQFKMRSARRAGQTFKGEPCELRSSREASVLKRALSIPRRPTASFRIPVALPHR